MTDSPVFSINLTSKLSYVDWERSSDPEMLYRSQVWRLVHAGLRKRNHVLWHLQLFSGRLPVKIVKTLNDRQSALLAESLRSFLDKSGKRKAESGKRKEERGKRKEERGKRKEERGKRKEESGKRKEERGKRKEEKGQRKEEKEESGKRKEEAEKSSKGHKTWFRFLSPVNQTLNLRSIKSFTIAWLFLIDI